MAITRWTVVGFTNDNLCAGLGQCSCKNSDDSKFVPLSMGAVSTTPYSDNIRMYRRPP